MSEFNFELALSLYNSTDPFPVDFDDAWVWYEFSTKGNAKRSFDSCGFIDGIDYAVVPIISDNSDNQAFLSSQEKAVLQNTKKIKLTIDCFKTWGMQIGTPKGKEVRKYFLECEKVAKTQHSYFDARFLEMETRLNTNMVNTLAPLVEKITKFEQSCQDHKGAGKVVKASAEDTQYSDEILTVNEYCAKRGLARELWNTFRRRYGDFVRVGKGLIPPKKNGRLAITGIFFEYADAVLANVMEFV